MNICPTCNTTREPFNLGPIRYTPDEKLAFVENVCSLLVKSRYGMDRPYQLLVQMNDEPERENCTFYDLTGEGPVPSYVIEFLDDEFVDKLTRDLYAKRVGIFAHIPPRSSPQNSARGSPRHKTAGPSPPS